MKSISSKLTIGYSSIVTLTVILILVFGRIFLERQVIQGIDLISKAEFEEIKARIIITDDVNLEETVIKAIEDHTEIDAALFMFQIGRSDNDVFFTSSNLGNHQLPQEIHGIPYTTVEMKDFGKLRVAEFKLNGLDIHIASSLQPVTELFKEYTKTGIITTLLTFIISIVSGYFMSRLALNPIIKIQNAAQQISASNLSERIEVPKSQDEIAKLALLLNDMIMRLEESFIQVQRFTSDASHELRTPLSLIRLQAEKIRNNPDLPKNELNKSITDQLEEIERLNKIIEDLLLLAKADSGTLKLNLKLINAQDYIYDFTEDAEILCEEKKLTFNVNNNDSLVINIDTIWMRHVLLNLLTNSIKYSSEKSIITLTSQKSNNYWEIIFADEGSGIPENELPYIFNRFSRIPEFDLTKPNSGSGLGLAICKSIILKHNGSIEVKNREKNKGLFFIISIPINV